MCGSLFIVFYIHITLGHSHNDDDSEIGMARNFISNLALPDFENFKRELINAFVKNNQAHCDV